MATGRCSVTVRAPGRIRKNTINRRIKVHKKLKTVQQSQLHVHPARHGRITKDSSMSFLFDPWRLSNLELADNTTHPVARYDATYKHKHKTADDHNITIQL